MLLWKTATHQFYHTAAIKCVYGRHLNALKMTNYEIFQCVQGHSQAIQIYLYRRQNDENILFMVKMYFYFFLFVYVLL